MKNKSLFIILIIFIISCDKNDEYSEMNNGSISITINQIDNLTPNSATISGSVINNGSNSITDKGFCWSLTNNPSLNNNCISLGSGGGMFTTTLNNLDVDQTYFVRAYANLGNETNYSEPVSFTTLTDCSSNVFPYSVDLSTQAEVNSFGLNNYCEVTGTLNITSAPYPNSDFIIDLSPLASLYKVGNLSISATLMLETLSGLENLTEIGAGIFIGNNQVLTNIHALENVSSEISYLEISGNPLLQNIDSLNGITTMIYDGVPPRLLILGNPELDNIDGLSNISIMDEGFISIASNDQITNLQGLSSIPSNIGALRIFSNNSLIDLNGIEHLESISGELSLGYNNNLQSIDQLAGITHLGSLLLKECDMMTNLEGLSGLISIEADCEIVFNDSLIDFCGLQVVVNSNGIGGNFIVEFNGYNPTLEDIMNGNCSI